jgi:hypothetical protein
MGELSQISRPVAITDRHPPPSLSPAPPPDRARRRAPLRLRAAALPRAAGERRRRRARQPAGRSPQYHCQTRRAKPAGVLAGLGSFSREEAPGSFRQNATKIVEQADPVQLSWQPAGRTATEPKVGQTAAGPMCCSAMMPP